MGAGTIASNFWIPLIMGYTIRLTGAKLYGSGNQQGFHWLIRLCVNGAGLTAMLAVALLVVFRSTLPYTFASDSICELMFSPCSAPVYDEVFGDSKTSSFSLTYALFAGFLLPSTIAPLAAASLYAAQDFGYVRNLAAVNLVVYIAVAAVAKELDSVVVLQVASVLPDIIMVLGCGRRLLELKRNGGVLTEIQRLSVGSGADGADGGGGGGGEGGIDAPLLSKQQQEGSVQR